MEEEIKSIVCLKCGNDKFSIRESAVGAFSVGCSECGYGYIFGGGLSARSIASILKGDDKRVDNNG